MPPSDETVRWSVAAPSCAIFDPMFTWFRHVALHAPHESMPPTRRPCRPSKISRKARTQARPSLRWRRLHVAISEHRDGTTVVWMEQVSDEQYNVTPSTSGGRAATVTPAPVATTPQSQSARPQPGASRPSGPLQQKVAPGMAALTDDVLYGDVWRRSELPPRDRSLVTAGRPWQPQSMNRG